VRLRWSRPLATAIVFLLLLLLLSSFIYAVSALIVNQAPQLSQELRQVWSEMSVWLQRPFTILNFTVQPQLWLDYLERAASTLSPVCLRP
jgi:predicted PurR-regulated permease PerM